MTLARISATEDGGTDAIENVFPYRVAFIFRHSADSQATLLTYGTKPIDLTAKCKSQVATNLKGKKKQNKITRLHSTNTKGCLLIQFHCWSGVNINQQPGCTSASLHSIRLGVGGGGNLFSAGSGPNPVKFASCVS